MTYAAASTDLANGGWFGFGHADFVRQTPVLTFWYGESPFLVPNATTTRIGSGKRGLPYGSLSKELFSGRTSFGRTKSATLFNFE